MMLDVNREEFVRAMEHVEREIERIERKPRPSRSEHAAHLLPLPLSQERYARNAR